MDRSPRDKHLFDSGPKRILALDGGGIRGILTLQILRKIEAIVRQRSGNPTASLSDYFDLIGGTSTGSIIASGLALGWSVDRLDTLYRSLGSDIFKPDITRLGPMRIFRPKFSANPLKKQLEENFGGITLGDSKLKTGLAIVAKRLDTGSPWVMFNNPEARYFHKREGSDSIPNQDYLLSNIIRASTAAPSFFQPESIAISDDVTGAFVDGGVSPHNNPALQMFLLAILKGYNLNWPTGADNLLLVSVGTGFKALKEPADKLIKMGALQMALTSLQSLMDDASHLNELLLQIFSNSPTARQLDREVERGEFLETNAIPQLLSYLRYDAALEKDWLVENLGKTYSDKEIEKLLEMDDPSMMDTLSEVGELTAEKRVHEHHFPKAFDI